VLGLFRSIAFALLVLVVPVALVATNIRFAASEVRVYDYSVREYNAEAAAAIPESELIRANRELVSYFRADDPGPLSIVVTNTSGEEETLFNARETVHLADVRDLFQLLFKVQLIAVALVLSAAMVLLVTASVRALAQGLLYGSVFTVALVAATGGLAAFGFEQAWTQFHFLAFTNDFWRLNPATDHLIQMFPEPFWFDITILIGAFTLLEVLLIGGASGLYLLLTRPDEEGEQPVRPVPVHRPPEPRPRIPPPRPRHLTH
jgi:integral membrane protein (TIGR01906 family)